MDLRRQGSTSFGTVHIVQLAADKLIVERGTRQVLSGVSFEVPGGQALVLMGANGAGKTTLLRAIAGLLPLKSGHLGLEPAESDAPIAERCHFVGHRDAVKSQLSVRDNLTFWQRFEGGAPSLVETALSTFGIARLSHVPAGYLSAGQRRRLSLARLLVAPRPLWLLDEPNVALDAQGRTLLADVVNAHLRDGGLVVAATHLPLGFTPMRELEITQQPSPGGEL